MNRLTKNLATLLTASAVVISGCASAPELKQNSDMTGDGIEDAIVDINYGPNEGTYLFIGQKDGTFVRAKQYQEASGAKYFKSDDGKFYFFDGKFYRESVPFDSTNAEKKE